MPPTVRFPTLSAGMAVGRAASMPDEYSDARADVMALNNNSAGVSAARAARAPSPSPAHSDCSQSPSRTFSFNQCVVHQRLELRRFLLGSSRGGRIDTRRG